MSGSKNGSAVGSTLLGVVLGGVIGVGVGLLVAPEKGQKIRRRLAYQLNHIVRRITKLVEHVNHIHEESEARRTGAALVADVNQQAAQIMSDVDALMNEIKRNKETNGSP
jgi:gas vesicle protein